MPKTNYIILNGKPFEFTNRSPNISMSGAKWLESLDGTPHLDCTNIVEQWMFTMEGLDDRGILRLKDIFMSSKPFPFIDYDGQTYNVVWYDTNFNPVEITEGVWNISFPLRRVQT